MTLSKLRVSPYGVNDELSSAEMTILNDEIDHAVDGVDGGTYAPSPAITIGGDGLIVTGTLEATGNTNLEGVVLASVSVTIDGGSSALLELTSGATLHGHAGSILTWDGAATFNDPVIFADLATCNSGLQVTAGTVSFGSAVHVGDVFTILDTATATINTPLNFGAGLGFIKYRELIGPDADTTIAANTYDVVTQTGALTAARTYTLEDAPNGTMIHMSAIAAGLASFAVHVHRQDASLIVSYEYGSGVIGAVTLIVRAGVWQVHSWSVT